MLTNVVVPSRSALIAADRRRVHRSTVAAVAGGSLIALSALALAGCSASHGAVAEPVSPAAPASSAPTASSPPARSSTAPDPSAAATKQVLAFFPTYVRTIDELFDSATAPLNSIYTVSVDPAASSQVRDVAQFRGAGNRASGFSVVSAARVTSVTLTNEPKAKPPERPTVVVTACVDLGQDKAVDSAGRSVIVPGTPRYLIDTATVVNLSYPAATGWRVENLTNTQASSCAG